MRCKLYLNKAVVIIIFFKAHTEKQNMSGAQNSNKITATN